MNASIFFFMKQTFAFPECDEAMGTWEICTGFPTLYLKPHLPSAGIKGVCSTTPDISCNSSESDPHLVTPFLPRGHSALLVF